MMRLMMRIPQTATEKTEEVRMPTRFDPETEKMIEVFSDFLNAHFADNRDETMVRREDYDEYDDPPKIYADNEINWDYRIITLYAHPFHDEGGPNILTGF